jgi:hypothetical protein
VIQTAEGSLAVHFGDAQQPLGFTLQLVDSYRNSTTTSDEWCECAVRVIGAAAQGEVARQVSQKAPLSYGGISICPVSSQDAGHGKIATNFRVAYDPGKSFKKVGGWSLFFGIVVMITMRCYLPSEVPSASQAKDCAAVSSLNL